MRRADEALYAAKLGGRNRVYLHDGQQCRLITKADPTAGTHDANGPVEEPLNSTEKQASVEKLDRMQKRLRRIVEEESQRIVQR